MPGRLNPPPLVQDGADIFSPDAEAEAEARLRSLAAEHGVWIFILTELDPDIPRVLDRPIQQATDAGVPAVGFVMTPDRFSGIGNNEQGERFRVLLTTASLESALDDDLSAGRTDQALARHVAGVEAVLRDQ